MTEEQVPVGVGDCCQKKCITTADSTRQRETERKREYPFRLETEETPEQQPDDKARCALVNDERGVLQEDNFLEASEPTKDRMREVNFLFHPELRHHELDHEEGKEWDHGEGKEDSPLTSPTLQKPRPVRANRGMKRRFPGEESDDNTPRRHTRVRSMIKLCGQSTDYARAPVKVCKGKKALKQEGKKKLGAKSKGRPSKSGCSSKFITSKEQLSEEAKEIGYLKRKVLKENQGPGLKNQRSRRGGFFIRMEDGDELLGATALYRHRDQQTNRPYACHYEGCSKRFTERSKLKRHFLIHTGEKSFVCLYEGCGKAFSLDFNLRSHMKTHTGEYHECPHEGCDKRYCQEYKLRAHICKDHKENNANGRNEAVEINKDESPLNKGSEDEEIKEEKLRHLELWRGKLEKWKEGRQKRIQELEMERESEVKELTKIVKALRKLEKEREQLELEVLKSKPSSDEVVEEGSGLLSGEEEEPLLFAGQLQTGDQGASLVQVIDFPSPKAHPFSGYSSMDLFLLSRSVPDAGTQIASPIINSQPPTAAAQMSSSQTNSSLYFGGGSLEVMHAGQPESSLGDLGVSFNRSCFWRGVPEVYVSSETFPGIPLGCACGSKGVSDAFASLDALQEEPFSRAKYPLQSEHPVAQFFAGQEQLCLAD